VKYLIYSDCHFSQYSSIVRTRGYKYSTRLENLIKSISWAEHLADDEDCDMIINLGDTFDRPDLNSEELTAFQDIYFSSKPHIILTGNHDASISNLEFSSAQIFKSIDAKVITGIESMEINNKVDFYFIPYLTTDKLKPLADIVFGDKKKVIFSHNDLAGIQYGKFTSQSGFDVKDILNNCTLFINGHLHNSCVIEDKIILVGNLTGQNFNEDATKYDHYVYILSIDDAGAITVEPHINPHAFNFYKININTKSDLSKLNALKQNPVLSITCNSKLLQKVTDIINSKNVIEYRLITTYSDSNTEEPTINFKVEDHLQQFINYVQTKIPPSDILSEELGLLSKS